MGYYVSAGGGSPAGPGPFAGPTEPAMFGFKTKALAAAEIKDAIQTFDVIAHCYGGREVVGAITAVNEADAFDAAFAEPGKWFGTGQVEYVTVATAA